VLGARRNEARPQYGRGDLFRGLPVMRNTSPGVTDLVAPEEATACSSIGRPRSAAGALDRLEHESGSRA